MFIKARQQGYTLIEVMLVLSLIAAITLGGLSLYRNRMINSKIEKTALQMQQWLQGAQIFYIKNARWPTDTDHQDMLEHYLPTHSDKNSWGNEFEISQALDPQGSIAANLFRVQSQVPAEPLNKNTDNSVLAERIAGLLPNAGVLQSDIIYAEITMPGQNVGKSGQLQVLSIDFINLPETAFGIGNINSNPGSGAVRVEKPTEQSCPRTVNEPHVYFSLAGITFNNQAYLNSLPKKKQVSKYLQHTYANIVREDDDAWYINIASKAFRNSTYYNHSGRLLVIKTCQAKPPADPQIISASSPFLF